MVLVDTSIWIDVFRRGHPPDLGPITDLNDVVTCLPVVQEVLQGFRDDVAFHRAKIAMDALPIVESPIDRMVIGEAVDLFRRARHAGITVRSSVDCLIAACAIRHGLEVLHHDRDFDALARISTLQSRNV